MIVLKWLCGYRISDKINIRTYTEVHGKVAPKSPEGDLRNLSYSGLLICEDLRDLRENKKFPADFPDLPELTVYLLLLFFFLYLRVKCNKTLFS